MLLLVFIRQLLAIPWYWQVLFHLGRCWGYWLLGFQRNARCSSIPWYCCARS